MEVRSPIPDVPDFSNLGDLITEGTWRSWAVFSADRKYRYMLGRCWLDITPLEESAMRSSSAWPPAVPTMLYAMLNPSVADAVDADPTIRKCIGFAERRKAKRIVVVNLFALRATDPRELTVSKIDPIGIHNPLILASALAQATRGSWCEIAAWGRFPSRAVEQRARTSIAQLRAHERPFQCFGRTKDGQPRHPLMLSYETPIEPWRVEKAA